MSKCVGHSKISVKGKFHGNWCQYQEKLETYLVNDSTTHFKDLKKTQNQQSQLKFSRKKEIFREQKKKN